MLKITVTQASIEQAVREYVLKQLVNQDQDVEVILAATRGADGITAEVNVGAKGEIPDAVSNPATTSKESAPTTTAVKTKQETVVATAKSVEVEKVEEPVVKQVDSPAEVVEEKAPIEGDQATDPEPVRTVSSGSLFAGLTRPNNAE